MLGQLRVCRMWLQLLSQLQLQNASLVKLRANLHPYISIWNRNSKVQSCDLPVPSLLILPTDLLFPLSSRLYPQPANLPSYQVSDPSVSAHMVTMYHTCMAHYKSTKSAYLLRVLDASPSATTTQFLLTINEVVTEDETSCPGPEMLKSV